jgi:hypothetical protein
VFAISAQRQIRNILNGLVFNAILESRFKTNFGVRIIISPKLVDGKKVTGSPGKKKTLSGIMIIISRSVFNA